MHGEVVAVVVPEILALLLDRPRSVDVSAVHLDLVSGVDVPAGERCLTCRDHRARHSQVDRVQATRGTWSPATTR